VIEVLRAGDVPARDQLDYWHQVVMGKCGVHQVRMPDGLDPTDELRLGAAGMVRIDELRAAKTFRADRTARHIRQDADRDLCKLHVVAQGRVAVRQDGREAVLTPGDFVLVDNEEPVSKVMASVRFVTLAFPKALLPLGRDAVAKLKGLRFDGNDGLGALTSSFVRQLVGRLGTWDGTEGARLGTTLLDLLTVALGTRLDRDDAGPADGRHGALLARIHGYIEENLADPRLSPTTVAAANSVSVRYLHRLFETQETTVAAWIRRRRLERCRRDLADPSRRTVPVSTIAAQWGLTNPTHFGRQFRSEYGVLPTEYRAAAQTRAVG
jgi:AraC-like DNA-binding protein